MASTSDEEEGDCCSICLMGLDDAEVVNELGEPLRTACGHRFHAVCFARHMEASEHDPWCPNCRSGELAVNFAGLCVHACKDAHVCRLACAHTYAYVCA